MFTFNLPQMLSNAKHKMAKNIIFKGSLGAPDLPTPEEIRQNINKMSRCPKCHFLIFDHYWALEVESTKVKLCPTCGKNLDKERPQLKTVQFGL